MLWYCQRGWQDYLLLPLVSLPLLVNKTESIAVVVSPGGIQVDVFIVFE